MSQPLTFPAREIGTHAIIQRGAPCALGLALSLFLANAMAQPGEAGKTIVPEPTGLPAASTAAAPLPAFTLFTQWIDRVMSTQDLGVTSEPVSLQEFTVVPGSATGSFEPAPVILGQPDFPLLGQAAAQASQQWNAGLNYQGVSISYIVLDASGRKHEIRPVSKGLAAGERFRIRYTTSFDAVTSMDSITGEDPWYGQRAGQVWPKAGMSVQSAAGQTIDLPLGARHYFVMRGTPSERYVLTIRHPKAKDQLRSNQPAYRQDGTQASQYLQLIPAGSHPAIEQLLMVRSTSR